MRLRRSKKWFKDKINQEDNYEVGAGIPPKFTLQERAEYSEEKCIKCGGRMKHIDNLMSFCENVKFEENMRIAEDSPCDVAYLAG
jgi:hypothetical protein